ncbi:DUF5803 family protein [Methanoregula sp.]|jgi:hypothetical protein|uniref:DUF5803 family protein n=1 Tax=Methanoregula sp. TaxID=2052170 RepID=UPI003C2181BB
MRTTNGDRRRSVLAALCTALVIALAGIPAAGALFANYTVLPNGTAYNASVEITSASEYMFSDVGIMGENVPVQVGNVQLSGNCSPCTYNWSRPWGAPASITFEKGNYTVSYTEPLQDNTLQGTFDSPYQVNVTIPEEFDVRNPLLAGISQGGVAIRHGDNTTTVQWIKTVVFNVRFYDPGREELLWFFLQFMGILVLVLVVIPWMLSMKKAE